MPFHDCVNEFFLHCSALCCAILYYSMLRNTYSFVCTLRALLTASCVLQITEAGTYQAAPVFSPVLLLSNENKFDRLIDFALILPKATCL